MILRTISSFLLLILMAGWTFSASASDLVKKKSSYSVAATLDRLEAILQERSIAVMARIDHQKGAEKTGKTLRPTQLLLFGNPAIGTQLMQLDQMAGIALPMKVLAWQDAEGSVWIAYEEPASLAMRFQIPADHPALQTMANALKNFTDEAARP